VKLGNEINPSRYFFRYFLFFLAVYAPAIAAFILVAHSRGLAGLKRFLSRILLWRTSFGWHGFPVLGVPLFFYAGAAVQGRPLTGAFPFDSAGALSTAILPMAVKGPVEEEADFLDAWRPGLVFMGCAAASAGSLNELMVDILDQARPGES
jgi:hypothetical protein